MPGGPGLPTDPEQEKAVKALTKDQKKLLKEIHQRYGTLASSQLGHSVHEGDQKFDLKLK